MSYNPKNKTSNKKSNGKKRYHKTNGKGKAISRPDNRQEFTKEEGDINNPSYYYGDATVLDQVMNFSFNEFGGVPFDITMSDLGEVRSYHNQMIASYWLNPSIPQSLSNSPYEMDGSTTAALRNFLLLSGSNAKTTNYAPQDVIVLTLAVAELIKVATFIARAFGVAYLFNYRNRSYPESLLRAMGIDPTTFNTDLADLRVRYNKLLAIASKIPFPAEIPLFKKAAELYASIYLDDGSSALAQTYMFVPYSVWYFNETYDANGAGLDTVQLVNPSTLTSMSTILTGFEAMISALVNSTSLNSIYSDIIRLAQNNKLSSLITFNPIPENFVVLPVYNEEIKIWIHNAIITGAPLATNDQFNTAGLGLTPLNDVSCDANTNKLKYHPQFKHKTECGYEALLDFDHDTVTVTEKVEAVRLAQRWKLVKDSGNYYTTEVAMNDEYLVCVNFYTGATNAVDYQLTSSFDTPTTIASAVGSADCISKFDWAPLIYWKVSTTAVYPIGDLDYYTLMDWKTVKKIFDYEIIHLLQIG